MSILIGLQILEALYYISCLGLLIVAIIGLKQLKIAKDIAKMNAKRESLKLANSQVHFYLSEIIEYLNTLDVEIEKYNIKFFDNAKVFIEGKSIRVKLNSNKNELKKLENVAKPLLDALNAMESFATFFTSKLADEKIAFKAVGKTYCNSVKNLIPGFISHTSSGYHTSILDLFIIWNNRLEQKKLQNERKNIEDKLLQIDSQTIYPLGTD